MVSPITSVSYATTTDRTSEIRDLQKKISEIQNSISELQGNADMDADAKNQQISVYQTQLSQYQSQLSQLQAESSRSVSAPAAQVLEQPSVEDGEDSSGNHALGLMGVGQFVDYDA